MLPEGQDPDDLARTGGPAAVERVLSSARPLVDVLWAREFEAGPLDTPERRAALERRLRESLALIRDETLRRYYREDVESRLAALSPDTRPSRFNRQNGGGRRDFQKPQPMTPSSRLSISPLLARSALFAGSKTESPREAVILCTFLVHPELIQNHVETLADLELEGRATQMVRSLLLDGAASGEPADLTVMRARLERAGLTAEADRLTALVRPGDRWMLDPHADPLRLEDALRQAITLHRRARTLHSELRAAERALAEEDNEANLAWLREVQNQLSSVEGAEADMDNAAASGGF
jgi:DNA primase